MRLGFDSTRSWASVEWMGRNSSKNIPSFGVLRIAMESSDKSVQYLPIGVQLGRDLVTVKGRIIFPIALHGHPGRDQSHQDRNISSKHEGDHNFIK